MNNQTFIIEKQVPVTPSRRGMYFNRTSRWRKLAEQMNEGDSVLLDKAGEATQLASYINETKTYRAVQRKTLEGKHRVWKLAKTE